MYVLQSILIGDAATLTRWYVNNGGRKKHIRWSTFPCIAILYQTEDDEHLTIITKEDFEGEPDIYPD